MRVYHDFNFIEVKSLSEQSGFYTLEGMATTNTPDRQDDIVEPSGCRFAPVIPLLLGHDAKKPVGEARLGRPTSKGIPFTARIPVITRPGRLKELVDQVIDSIQHGLIRCVSIGFRVLSGGAERLPSGGKKFTSVEIMELSLCVIPAQPEAVIDSFRSGKSTKQTGRAIKLDRPPRKVIQLIKARRPIKLKRSPSRGVELIPAPRPTTKAKPRAVQVIRAAN